MTSVTEQTAIVRKRRFHVRSVEDVAKILRVLRIERFQGFVRIDIANGGVPASAEAEERQGIDLTTRANIA